MAADTPGLRFREWEPEPISTWSEFQVAVNSLTSSYADHRLVWRGVRNADWGLYSSLYRALSETLGRPPTEDDMVRAEKSLLTIARDDWRFDGTSALELLAQVQHFGGPTRLI